MKTKHNTQTTRLSRSAAAAIRRLIVALAAEKAKAMAAKGEPLERIKACIWQALPDHPAYVTTVRRAWSYRAVMGGARRAYLRARRNRKRG